MSDAVEHGRPGLLLSPIQNRGIWRAQGDDLRTFLDEFVVSLQQFVFLPGLNLQG